MDLTNFSFTVIFILVFFIQIKIFWLLFYCYNNNIDPVEFTVLYVCSRTFLEFLPLSNM